MSYSKGKKRKLQECVDLESEKTLYSQFVCAANSISHLYSGEGMVLRNYPGITATRTRYAHDTPAVTHTRRHRHTQTHTLACTYKHTRVHMHPNKHTLTHTCTHTHTHIHTYTQYKHTHTYT
jgi:hypothetical protein